MYPLGTKVLDRLNRREGYVVARSKTIKGHYKYGVSDDPKGEPLKFVWLQPWRIIVL